MKGPCSLWLCPGSFRLISSNCEWPFIFCSVFICFECLGLNLLFFKCIPFFGLFQVTVEKLPAEAQMNTLLNKYSADPQYQQLFINLVRTEPNRKTNISSVNNVFVIFKSFVYDGCVSRTDLHKHCQSWDFTFSTKVAQYKQHSWVLIHIV